MELRQKILLILSEYGSEAITGTSTKVKTAFESIAEDIVSIALSKKYRNIRVSSAFSDIHKTIAVPWIACSDTKENRVQYREALIMLLFRADMAGLYLTINQGGGMKYAAPITTLDFLEDMEIGSLELSKEFAHIIDSGFSFDRNIDLADPGVISKTHEKGTVAYKYYPRSELPIEDEIERDIGTVLDAYEKFISNLHSEDLTLIREEDFLNEQEQRERQTRNLSYSELLKKAEAPVETTYKQVLSNRFDRNVNVSEIAHRRADGKCQLCGYDAPFKDPDGEPFLEVHHIIWLSEGGKDAIENVVALCPNCHRRMHILNSEEDKAKLYSRINSFK